MSEATEAARDGARLQRNSGRGILEKGDAVLGPYCVDYKEYDESFSVSRNVWAKATRDAVRMKLQPALKLVLGEKEKNAKTRLWVIGDAMFHEMYEAWKEKYGDAL